MFFSTPPFRLFSEFTVANEYLMLIVFIYAILHIFSTLLVLDSQLVEYYSLLSNNWNDHV